MKRIQGFLIDLDGVLYTGDTVVDGAVEAIRTLRERGFPCRFISNSTRRCRGTIVERLSSMGFDIAPEEILTPLAAANSYIKKTKRLSCYCILAADALEDLDQARPPHPGEKADWVIIGDAGEMLTFTSLNAAFRHLMDGARLIALERDRFWMASDGPTLSAGPYVKALEFAARKRAVVIGKPSKSFFSHALHDLGLAPDQVAMVGDDIHTDISGAQRMGIRGVLVRTGKYRLDVLKNAGIRPAFCIDSIASLPGIL